MGGLEIRKVKNTGISIATDTDSIDLTASGSTLTADLRISSNAADAGYKKVALNIESATSKGLRAQLANEDIQDAAFGILVDTTSINLTYDDALDQLYADLNLSADPADAGYFLPEVTIESDGLKVQIQQSDIDHGSISGLGDDDHTQYHLLAGRATGQTATGGNAASENLTLRSTSHATKGKVLVGTSAYDETANDLGLGTASPVVGLDVVKDVAFRKTDIATAGTISGLTVVDKALQILSACTQLSSMVAGQNGQVMILVNSNSVTMLVKNELGSETAANRIVTGTGDDIELGAGASLFFAYDTTASRWRVIGGAGGGALSIKSNQTLAAAATIALAGTGQQLIRVQGSGGAITVSATTGVTNGTKDGQTLRLQGLSDTNTVTLTAAGNMALNGDCVLGNRDILDLMWVAADSAWVEVSRSE